MILTVDIGNSNIVIGGVEGEEILFEARLRTDATKTSDEYCIDLKSILDVYGVNSGKQKQYIPTPAFELFGDGETGIEVPSCTSAGDKESIQLHFGRNSSLSIECVSVAVDGDGQRKVFNFKPVDCFRSEVVKRYNICLFDALGDESSGSSGGGEVDRFVLFHRFDNFG
jgi:hypothetical protein